MRDDRSGWISLSRAEFFLLWTGPGLDDPPALFGLPRVGRTAAARQAHAEQASRDLAARGLGTVTRPAEDLAGMLRVLAEPARTIDLVTEPGGLRALAAGTPTEQVTVAVSGDEVRLGPIRNGTMAGSLLDAVPPAEAGPGRTANLRLADYERACRRAADGGAQRFLDELRELGLRQPEAHTLYRALTERRGGGQFGATVRGQDRRPVRVAATVTWLDTPQGRYALQARDGWLTVTPANLIKLSELVTALT